MRARAAALALALLLLGGCSRCRKVTYCRTGLEKCAVRRAPCQGSGQRSAGSVCRPGLRDLLDLLRADGVPLIFSPRGEERRAKQKLGC